MARLMPWAVVAAVLSGVTINVLRLRPDASLAGASLAAQALEICAGMALIVVGGAAGRGPERWLLPAAGASWLMADWANPAAPGAFAFTAGLIEAMTALPCALASQWRRSEHPSGGTPSRWQSVMLGLAVLAALAAAVSSGPLAAAAASPTAAGCTDCPRDLIALSASVPLSNRLTQLGFQLAILAGLIAVAFFATCLISAWRYRARRRRPPDLAASIAVTAFAVAVAIGAVAFLRSPADPATYVWRATASFALLGLCACVVLPALHAARARRAVARVAVLAAEDPDGLAVAALRSALGDDDLLIAYPTPGGAWQNHRGEPVRLPDPYITLVTDAGEVLAALIHGENAQRPDHTVVTEAVSAARILLDTERIEAGAMARLSDLRSARRLVMETADAARAGLERDLHDGAQQRLVALRFALGLAVEHAERLPEPDAAVALADADWAAERALSQLRELAHGISAATLAVEGLAGAVRSLAENAQIPVTIIELPSDRLPERVERAAYRFIADGLRDPGHTAKGFSLSVRRKGDAVTVDLEREGAVTGTRWPPLSLADRIAAAGGELRQADLDERCLLTAVLPCE